MKFKSIILITGLFTSHSIILAQSRMINSHDSHEHDSRKPLDSETKKQLISALEANEILHESFYNYDSFKIEKNAAAVSISLSQIKSPEIAQLLKFSIGKLNNIKANNDRKTNNQNYHTVSMTLIHLINTFDLGENYKGYFCPMVKMKWVQNTEKLTKPKFLFVNLGFRLFFHGDYEGVVADFAVHFYV